MIYYLLKCYLLFKRKKKLCLQGTKNHSKLKKDQKGREQNKKKVLGLYNLHNDGYIRGLHSHCRWTWMWFDIITNCFTINNKTFKVTHPTPRCSIRHTTQNTRGNQFPLFSSKCSIINYKRSCSTVIKKRIEISACDFYIYYPNTLRDHSVNVL